MASAIFQANGAETLADLVHRLGDIPLHRIRMQPPPGTATEFDLVAAGDCREKRLCELVDGVLVEKDMGAFESFLAGIVIQCINNDDRPKLTIRKIGKEIVIRAQTAFTTSRPDYHFLARWWVNGKVWSITCMSTFESL